MACRAETMCSTDGAVSSGKRKISVHIARLWLQMGGPLLRLVLAAHAACGIASAFHAFTAPAQLRAPPGGDLAGSPPGSGPQRGAGSAARMHSREVDLPRAIPRFLRCRSPAGHACAGPKHVTHGLAGHPRALVAVRMGSAQGAGHTQLQRWAEEQGAFVSPNISLGTDPQGIRGWVAAAPLAAGEVVLSIPATTTYAGILSASYVRAEREAGVGSVLAAHQDAALLAGKTQETLSDQAVLALFIAATRCALHQGKTRADSTLFGRYIATLPDEVQLPLCLRQAEQRVCVEAAAMRSDMLSSWNQCRDILGGQVGAEGDQGPISDPEIFGGVKVELADFEKAWCLVESRSFQAGLSLSGGQQVSFRSKYLLPIVDLLNHVPSHPGTGDGPVAQMIVDKRKGRTEWRVVRDVEAGEGVTWSYGVMTSRELVLRCVPAWQDSTSSCPSACPRV